MRKKDITVLKTFISAGDVLTGETNESYGSKDGVFPMHPQSIF
jgi:hypothetical protein